MILIVLFTAWLSRWLQEMQLRPPQRSLFTQPPPNMQRLTIEHA